MWHGFLPVGSYDPIIYEGPVRATLTVMNAGPAFVRLQSWDTTSPPRSAVPVVDLELRPGDIRSASGKLIRLKLADADPSPALSNPAQYAACGWKIVATDP